MEDFDEEDLTPEKRARREADMKFFGVTPAEENLARGLRGLIDDGMLAEERSTQVFEDILKKRQPRE